MGSTDPHDETAEDAPTPKKKKTLGSVFKTMRELNQLSPHQEQQALSTSLGFRSVHNTTGLTSLKNRGKKQNIKHHEGHTN